MSSCQKCFMIHYGDALNAHVDCDCHCHDDDGIHDPPKEEPDEDQRDQD